MYTRGFPETRILVLRDPGLVAEPHFIPVDFEV